MPTVRQETEIEFELWCETCGNGICRNTIYKSGSTNHFTTFCEKCEKTNNDLISRLEHDVSRLEHDVAYLEGRVAELEQEIKDLNAEPA